MLGWRVGYELEGERPLAGPSVLGWSVGYELEGERVGKYATGSKEGAPVGASDVGMTLLLLLAN